MSLRWFVFATQKNENLGILNKLDKKMTGPALRNVETRLSDDEGLDRAWIYAWIKNSAGMVKSGDAYANQIYNEYNGTAMTAFPQLEDQDISDILAYTATEPPVKIETTPTPNGDPVESGVSSKLILGALAILFALLAISLVLVRKTLNRFADEKGIEAAQKDKTPNKTIKPCFYKHQKKKQNKTLRKLPASTDTHKATEKASDIAKSSANGTSPPSLPPPSRSINKSWR